jgi:hypothetical protein
MHLWHFGELPFGSERRPVAPDDGVIDHFRTSIGRDPETGEVVASVTSVAELRDGRSRLDVRFRPGPGRSITTFELTEVLSGVHRAAMRAAHLERGEAHDGAAANETPAPSPAKQLGRNDFELIGHDEDFTIEEEQEADEFP